MKQLLFLFVLLISGSCKGQDSVFLFIHGKITDRDYNKPVSNAEITIIDTTLRVIDFRADSNGVFDAKIGFPHKHIMCLVEIGSKKHTGFRFRIDTTSISDIHLEKDIIIENAATCIDYFLPETIYFEYRSTGLSPNEKEWIRHFCFFVSENKWYAERYKIIVESTCAFNEPVKVSKIRLDEIEKYLSANLTGIEVEYRSLGKSEIVHYYYGHGCFTEKQRSMKLDLSKKVCMESEEREKEVNQLRRSIRFKLVARD